MAGAVTGTYALTEIYISGSKLPPGTCQVSGNRTMLYIAMILSGFSFILSVTGHGDGKAGRNNAIIHTF